MAIYIQINRVEEDTAGAVYEFGPVERIIGRVLLDKKTGKIELIDIEPEQADRTAFFVSRVRRKLTEHFARNELPERTCYAA